jgi:peptidase E
MVKKIYLLGGGYQDVFDDLDSKMLQESSSIFLVDFVSEDNEIIEVKKNRLKKHFEKIGFEKIEFASDFSDDEVVDKMDGAKLLFLCGGDTEILLKKIREKGLDKKIRDFDGIVEGNSAGAYVCCQEYVKIRDGNVEIIPALGFVDFCCKAHYTDEFDSQLLEYSNTRKIYGIPEEAYMIISGKDLAFVGDVYLFENGSKLKIN